jgi:deoxyribodipyrimidine photo-lyase
MMPSIDTFLPTLGAANARLAAVDINAYAKTRNAIDGAVSRLSPYVTHGFLSFPQIAKAVQDQAGFGPQHKFVFELGWRAYFHHVWQHLGDGIFESLHEGILPENAYQLGLPLDIYAGNTGIPVIDCAVQELVQTGYLHNHARMWLASYIVHIRKVHWLVGAQWMYGHLLDGDLASNMLSWQWVAGTGSTKPYLFNADNVAKYAPKAWHSQGTVLDASYEQLHDIAKTASSHITHASRSDLKNSAAYFQVPTCQALRALVKDRTVYLVHPWSLGDLPPALPADALILGVADSRFHAAHPWSAGRWDWVMTRMGQITPHCYAPSFDGLQAALVLASSVHHTPNPHAAWLADLTHPALQVTALPKLFTDVDTYCSSFAKWWKKTALRDFHSTEQ